MKLSAVRSTSRRRSDMDRLQLPEGLGGGGLGRQSLHAGGAEEPGHALGAGQDVLGVLGVGDRAAVAQDDDVPADGCRGVADGLDPGEALLQRGSGPRADGAGGGQPHVGDDDVGAGVRHRLGLLLVEDVRGGDEVDPVGLADHVDLKGVGHAGLFEVLPEVAVDQAHGREVLHAGEAQIGELPQEARDVAEGVGAADAGQDRGLLDDGQDFGGHLHDDGVGVAVGHESREGAAACHPVAAGVVDDDEVGAAALGALGRQAGPGAGTDHRAALLDLRAQSREDFLAGHELFLLLDDWMLLCSVSAISTANRGSLMVVLRRSTVTCSATAWSNAVNRAWSATASWNGSPSRSMAETPSSGIWAVTGPVAALRRSARRRPSSAFSLGVVRMSVTVALCVCRRRPANDGGTVSRGPKLTMSSAPKLTAWGMPARPAAVSRVGPAENTPPTSSSASSVVVMSRTPETKPASISPSMDIPPTPVQWKTRTS